MIFRYFENIDSEEMKRNCPVDSFRFGPGGALDCNNWTVLRILLERPFGQCKAGLEESYPKCPYCYDGAGQCGGGRKPVYPNQTDTEEGTQAQRHARRSGSGLAECGPHLGVEGTWLGLGVDCIYTFLSI